MSVAAFKTAPAPTVRPVEVIGDRLTRLSPGESRAQTAFAIIGALEQAGWIITRKRHFGDRP